MTVNPRKEIFNSIADEWDDMVNLSNEQKNTILDVINISEIKNDSNILDVGCGTGILAPYLLDKIGVNGKIKGIDVSDKMIEISKKKFQDQRATFVCDDIYNKSFKESSFDRIFVFSAFPHLHKKEEVMEIFHNLLSKDGKLIIFHVESSEDINKFHTNRVTNKVLQKDYLPNLDEIKKMIDENKWSIISLEDRTGRYLVHLLKK